ncbi:lipase family alpha/beta hydrolase [Eisenibacter elegans]|uniref:lipase family alpha/beta hydrolase n=1 Tax=Eisenibacter elegans TaxID=997 RepID=UPI0003F4DE89|nr:alpha/beta hydrolase [Eisenibacter elegans]
MHKFLKNLSKVGSHTLSILNGAVGDKLQNSLLEVPMGFYADNRQLPLEPQAIAAHCQRAASTISPKVCILIHGLTHNEMAWNFPDNSNYGTFLERDFGHVPFYLRYNTGLHISENGQKLTQLLEQLHTQYPVALEEICLLAHSMGGLLVHSACHYAQEQGHQWPHKVRFIFLLATPHLGSFLEQFAHLTTHILARVPNWQTRLVGKAIDLRSDGIKDLRFGYLREEDWQNPPEGAFERHQNNIQKLENAAYYVIAARLTQKQKHWVSTLFGDILVNTHSASAHEDQTYAFPPENCYEFAETNHFKIQTKPEVYEKIKDWITQTHTQNTHP